MTSGSLHTGDRVDAPTEREIAVEESAANAAAEGRGNSGG
jgi:hypothetical protein